jgi:AcrR family transcriptional regulator
MTNQPSATRSPPAAPNAPGRLITRDDIVTTALEIAAERGVDGVTMRTLADRLGVSVATAYYHVHDKADLLRLMVNASLAEVPYPPKDLPWDERLRILLRDVRSAIARHPGLFTTSILQSRAEGVEIGRLTEYTKEMIEDAGVPEDQREHALLAVTTYTSGQIFLDSVGQQVVPNLTPAVHAPGQGPEAFEPGPSFQILLNGIAQLARTSPEKKRSQKTAAPDSERA